MIRFNLLWLSIFTVIFIGCGDEPNLTEEQEDPEILMSEIRLDSLKDFQKHTDNWKIVGSVSSIPTEKHSFDISPGTGILANDPIEGGKDILTHFEHGDIDLELDFLMPKESNSGIYLMGRYEIQLLDSWGVENPSPGDCGGIYERWDDTKPEGKKGYEGTPPNINASRAPGLWQHLSVSFKAPVFDESGNKIVNAKMVEVILNGVTIHENVSLSGPTRGASFNDEKAKGPIRIQGDHGPIAFKNIRYRLIEDLVPIMSPISYKYYEIDDPLTSMPDFSKLTPVKEGEVETYDVKDRGTRANGFAFLFNSTVNIDIAADYIFTLASDDGGILYIDDKEVVNNDGNHGMGEVQNKVSLSQGPHNIELQYYQAGGGLGLRIDIESAQLPKTSFYTPKYMLKKGGGAERAIVLTPETRPLLHRGFTMHGTEKRTTTIGIGDPSGIHYIYDLEQGRPIKVWRGKFLDAGPMWISRGQTQLAIPLGPGVEVDGDPNLAMISADAAWPDSMPDQADFFPSGYELDANGYPTFMYSAYKVSAADKIKPNAEASSIEREITFTGDKTNSSLWCKIASGDQIIQLTEDTYAINQEYYLTLGVGLKNTIQIREIDGISEMIVPVLKNEKETVINYSILW